MSCFADSASVLSVAPFLRSGTSAPPCARKPVSCTFSAYNCPPHQLDDDSSRLPVNAPLVLPALTVALATARPLAAPRPPDIPFRIQMLDGGASETAAVADINTDGRLDIVSGENWYEAPVVDEAHVSGARLLEQLHRRFQRYACRRRRRRLSRHRHASPGSRRRFRGSGIPARRRARGSRRPINSGFNIEFATLADIDNDGKANEIVAQENGTGQAWYEVRDKALGQARRQRPQLRPRHRRRRRQQGRPQRHPDAAGLARSAGGSARGRQLDLSRRVGVRERPGHAARQPGGAPRRRVRPAARSPSSGFMHVLDVNGDGRNDVVTAAGHDYGVFWFEQGADGKWTKRIIDNAWSQGHASTLDRHQRRRPARLRHRQALHGPQRQRSRRARAARRVLVRVPPGRGTGGWPRRRTPQVEWIRHLIDFGGRMGGGMQIPVVDLDGDGDLDVVCAGKSGLFLAENLTKSPRTRATSR